MSLPNDLLQERYERRIGDTIQKYRIDALLGIGGMAAVFRARHRNGNPVALKVLHAEQSIEPDTRARFLREGYAANKVAHPGAVRVLDDDITEDGTVFLVMELLEGETLEARWERCARRLPVGEVATIAYQLLDVLAAAHDQSIVHRDIKPENVFITTEGMVKVLDFGIARLGNRLTEHSSTRTGSSVGTPAFMPPEQALGRKNDIDRQSDIWAAAATMFTMLSGQYVHVASTPEELVVFTATKPARSLSAVAPHVPLVIANVFDRALAFEKADRWPDALSMRRALEQAHLEALLFPIPASVPAPPPSLIVPSGARGAIGPHAPTMSPSTLGAGDAVTPARGRRLALALGAGVLLGAAVIAVYAVTAGRPPAIAGSVALAPVASTPASPTASTDLLVATGDEAGAPSPAPPGVVASGAPTATHPRVQKPLIPRNPAHNSSHPPPPTPGGDIFKP